MFIICLILLTVPYIVLCETDYCKSARCKAGSHTMCLFPSTPGPKCQDYKNLMNGAERQQLLDLHNEFRYEISSGKYSGFGPAKNMKQLYWDVELETIAQRLIDQCYTIKDKICSDVERFKVGQIIHHTIFTGYSHDEYYDSSPSSTRNVFKGWSERIKDTRLRNIIDNSKSIYTIELKSYLNTSHLTELAWAETSLIGCGKSYFWHNESHTFGLTCNYGPRGNIIGKPILIKGEACSECPNGTKCGLDPKFPKLCASPNPPPVPMDGCSRSDLATTRLLQALTFVILQIKSSIY